MGRKTSADRLEDRATIHGDVYKLEKWTDRNLTEFKGKVLYLGQTKPLGWYPLRTHGLCKTSAEKEVGHQNSKVKSGTCSCILDSTRKSTRTNSRELTPLLGTHQIIS